MVIKTGYCIVAAFFFFVLAGVIGMNAYPFLQNEKALSLSLKWCGILALIIAMSLAYMANRGDRARWGKIGGFIVVTLVSTVIAVVAFQGWIVLCNCYLGAQKNTLVKGTVKMLHFPKKKKLLNHYTIVIEMEGEQNVIEIDVPTNNYSPGDPFSKEMKLGSLGILYSE